MPKKAIHRLLSASVMPDMLIAGVTSMKMEPLLTFEEARAVLNEISGKPASGFRKFGYLYPQSCDLSIIVPVYNTEKYVGDCLDSILSQKVNFTFEVIAVNDGSTDESLTVLNSRAAKDDRVRVLNQDNRGYSGARNAAIDVAFGKVLCFVDSDDMLAPGHLQRLWDALNESGEAFVSGTYRKMTESGRVLGIAEKTRSHGGPWSRLYPRDIWKDVRFPDGFWFEDSVIAYCIQSRYEEEFVRDAGYLRRSRPDSIGATHSSNVKSLDGYWIVEEMLDWCRSLKIPLEKVYCQTIRQFGPLLYERCSFLGPEERLALFSACCGLIRSVPEWEGLKAFAKGRWGHLENSLVEGDYRLWSECCKWL